MTKYNGWTNYETWYVNVHISDLFYFADETEDPDDITPEYVKERVEDLFFNDVEQNSLIEDIVSHFLSAVNYNELAVDYKEMCLERQSEAA